MLELNASHFMTAAVRLREIQVLARNHSNGNEVLLEGTKQTLIKEVNELETAILGSGPINQGIPNFSGL